jgi:hypothetical protein
VRRGDRGLQGPRCPLAPVGYLLAGGAQGLRDPSVVAADQVMAGRFAGERAQGDEQLVVS